jgi:hypothetical protein
VTRDLFDAILVSVVVDWRDSSASLARLIQSQNLAPASEDRSLSSWISNNKSMACAAKSPFRERGRKSSPV